MTSNPDIPVVEGDLEEDQDSLAGEPVETDIDLDPADFNYDEDDD